MKLFSFSLQDICCVRSPFLLPWGFEQRGHQRVLVCFTARWFTSSFLYRSPPSLYSPGAQAMLLILFSFFPPKWAKCCVELQLCCSSIHPIRLFFVVWVNICVKRRVELFFLSCGLLCGKVRRDGFTEYLWLLKFLIVHYYCY